MVTLLLIYRSQTYIAQLDTYSSPITHITYVKNITFWVYKVLRKGSGDSSRQTSSPMSGSLREEMGVSPVVELSNVIISDKHCQNQMKLSFDLPIK